MRAHTYAHARMHAYIRAHAHAIIVFTNIHSVTIMDVRIMTKILDVNNYLVLLLLLCYVILVYDYNHHHL